MTSPADGAAFGDGTDWTEVPGQGELDDPKYTLYFDRSVRAVPSELVVGAFHEMFRTAACAGRRKRILRTGPRIRLMLRSFCGEQR
jgi:hypothetical protein